MDQLIHVVRYGDELLVKRIVREPSGSALLTSDAEGKPAQRIGAEDLAMLHVQGRVVAAFGRV